MGEVGEVYRLEQPQETTTGRDRKVGYRYAITSVYRIRHPTVRAYTRDRGQADALDNGGRRLARNDVVSPCLISKQRSKEDREKRDARCHMTSVGSHANVEMGVVTRKIDQPSSRKSIVHEPRTSRVVTYELDTGIGQETSYQIRSAVDVIVL